MPGAPLGFPGLGFNEPPLPYELLPVEGLALLPDGPPELATAPGEFIVTGAGPVDVPDVDVEVVLLVIGPIFVDGPTGFGALAILTGGASGFGGAFGSGAFATGGIGIGG